MFSEVPCRIRVLALCMVVTGGISIATLTGSALAQSSHGHEHQHTEGPRGGQIAEVGPYDAEIVLEDGEIRVYLMTHEDPPTAVAASSGDIVVIAGGGSKKIVLSQDGEALVGKPDFEIQDGTKAVIRVKTADGKTHAGKAEIETD